MTLSEPMTYEYGQVTLIGEAKTKWSRIRPGHEHADNPVYDKYELQHSVVHSAVTFRLKDSPTGLLEGSHKYQFEFILPSTCPSSFTSDDQGVDEGYISYEVNGKFVTGSADLDKTYQVKIPVKVRQIVDINKAELLIAKQVSETMQIGFWCYNAGDIHFTAEIPRTGFCVVEDKIPLELFVNNNSSQSVSFEASIVQHRHYLAINDRKCETMKYDSTILTC